MSGKEQFIKLPRGLLESEAFGSLSINGFRLVRFLMIEHMRRGGRHNGHLKAPQRQLVAAGIGTHQVASAIREAEERGILECHRHGERVATTYGLTWLPLHDGTAATDAWQNYTGPRKRRKNLPVNQQAGLTVKQHAEGQKLPANQQSEPSENLPVNQQALYRSSYQSGGNLSVEEGTDVEVGTGEPCRFYVTGDIGFRICGKPSIAGTEHCPEHTRAPAVMQVPAGKPNGSAAA